MSLNELLQEKREDILRIATKRGASNVRVFGSVARGEAYSKSDIDLLVDLEPGRSLFDLGGLPQPFVANVASDYDELMSYQNRCADIKVLPGTSERHVL